MAVSLVPRHLLFGNPERVAPTLSPDGSRLAYVAPVDGVLNLWVGDRDGTDVKPITNDRHRGITQYFWQTNGERLLYMQDRNGDENWRLFAVDPATGDTRDLTPHENVSVRVAGLSVERPNELLLAMNLDQPQLHDVYHLDLTTGALDKIVQNPGFVGWLADKDLVVRAGIRPTIEGGLTLLVGDDADADWRVLWEIPAEDALSSGPLAFTEDGTGLFVRSSIGANASRLLEVDVATGETRRVLAEDATYDVIGVLFHPTERRVDAAMFYRERREYVVLEQSLVADFAALERRHGGEFQIAQRTLDDRTWLIADQTDTGPTRYFRWDRDTQESTYLFTTKPELDEFEFGNVEPFSFVARDGLEVHGYLTFPPGVDRRNLPTVLNVHGGPWVRVGWGFNPEGQWLANRGYLCVEVNYRGSIGYGKEFSSAGDKEWGAKMHDDLLDAVEWVVAKGYTDPARVGIYGGSYGGYAALVGATFTPDVFACAVDMCGPSNLISFIETIPEYWKPMIATFNTRVGNVETERDFLWERSPLSKVDQIKIPLLIAQGANDPRVKQSESDQIVAALRDKGIDHDYLVFEDEGHGFVKPENRLTFFARTERFLADHLGGRCEDDDEG